jgi:glutathione S-transferase
MLCEKIMLEVYHFPLCPFSRKLRIVLKEKKVEFELIQEPYWQRRTAFLKMNPAGETPVIIVDGKNIVASNNAIFEYIEETYPENKLIFGDIEQRNEIRRLSDWFDLKFYNEVTRYIFNEKITKTLAKGNEPNSQAIQAAKKNLAYHLDYISFLTRDNRYLVGNYPTMADFAAAAQISVLDFIGEIPWSSHANAKEWYARIKSRPSMKPILLDKIPNFYPPTYYSNPDF